MPNSPSLQRQEANILAKQGSFSASILSESSICETHLMFFKSPEKLINLIYWIIFFPQSLFLTIKICLLNFFKQSLVRVYSMLGWRLQEYRLQNSQTFSILNIVLRVSFVFSLFSFRRKQLEDNFTTLFTSTIPFSWSDSARRRILLENICSKQQLMKAYKKRERIYELL